jgi:hypothetical protein
MTIQYIPTGDWHIRTKKEDNEIINRRLTTSIQQLKKPFIIGGAGDLTDDGKKEQYKQLINIITTHKLDNSILISPGNHDVHHYGCETIGSPFQIEGCKIIYGMMTYYTQYMAIKLHGISSIYTAHSYFEGTTMHKIVVKLILPDEKAMFISLDSNTLDNSITNFARGALGAETLRVLYTILHDPTYEDYLKVIQLHHHPVFNDWFQLLEDADNFLKIIWDIPNTLTVFAHRHKKMVEPQTTGAGGYITAVGSLRYANPLAVDIFEIDKGKLNILPNNIILR